MTTTKHEIQQHRSPRQAGGEPRTIWGHSLAAAAVCVGTGAVVALIAIFGQAW